MNSAAVVVANDLFGSLKRMPVAFHLAMNDIRGKYRRTVLGPLWIVIGQLATVAGFVLVFSGLFNRNPYDYALYLSAGFPVWMLISSFLTDMPGVFIQSKGFMESFELPWLSQVWRRSIGYLLVFGHQIATLFVVMAVLRVAPSWEMLWTIPALGLVLVSGAGLGIALGVLGARYRDLQPAMGVVASFLFFFSPIMWHADQLHANHWVYLFNPIYYIVTLLRDPLLGHAPDPSIWIGAGLAAIASLAIGLIAFLLSRRRLYHWL